MTSPSASKAVSPCCRQLTRFNNSPRLVLSRISVQISHSNRPVLSFVPQTCHARAICSGGDALFFRCNRSTFAHKIPDTTSSLPQQGTAPAAGPQTKVPPFSLSISLSPLPTPLNRPLPLLVPTPLHRLPLLSAMPPRTATLLPALLLLLLAGAAVGQECATILEGPGSSSSAGNSLAPGDESKPSSTDMRTVLRLNYLRLRPVSRLKGGMPALEGTKKFMATFRSPENDNFHRCSAALLDSRWLLTAKSCKITKEFTAVFGAFPGMKLTIEAVFNAGDDLDAALVKLVDQDETEPNPSITAVRVNNNVDFPEVGVQARAVAFETKTDSKKIGELMQVEVPILQAKICDEADYGGNFKFDERKMICAGTEKCDYCEGDTGGPLLQFDASDAKRPVIVGIISNRNVCGAPDKPGVYTKMSALINFLDDTKKKDGDLTFTLIDNDPVQAKPSASPSPSPTASVTASPSVSPTTSPSQSTTPSPSPSEGSEPVPEVADSRFKGGSGGNSTLWILLVIGIVGILFTAGAWWRYRFATE